LYELPAIAAAAPSGPSALLTGKKLVLLWEDEFSECEGMWFCPDRAGTVACDNGMLLLTLDKATAGRTATMIADNKYDWETNDLLVEADITQGTGDKDCRAGLMFRGSKSGCYSVSIAKGSYLLDKTVGDNYSVIQSCTNSEFIKPDKETNRLKIICVGKTIELYANDHRLGTFSDDTSLGGWIVLLVSSRSTTSKAVYNFDNFKLYELQ
jgi:hypothetical protein